MASRKGRVAVVNSLLNYARDPFTFEYLIDYSLRNGRLYVASTIARYLHDIIINRKKIIDAYDIPEDLIFDISKYMHEDEDFYKKYR